MDTDDGLWVADTSLDEAAVGAVERSLFWSAARSESDQLFLWLTRQQLRVQRDHQGFLVGV